MKTATRRILATLLAGLMILGVFAVGASAQTSVCGIVCTSGCGGETEYVCCSSCNEQKYCTHGYWKCNTCGATWNPNYGNTATSSRAVSEASMQRLDVVIGRAEPMQQLVANTTALNANQFTLTSNEILSTSQRQQALVLNLLG